MKTLLQITAQVHENYGVHNWNGQGECPEYWKPKGGHEFQIVVDSNVLMYSNELEKHLTKIVSKQSDEREKFEYKGHEVQFSDPTMLGSGELYDLINSKSYL